MIMLFLGVMILGAWHAVKLLSSEDLECSTHAQTDHFDPVDFPCNPVEHGETDGKLPKIYPPLRKGIT